MSGNERRPIKPPSTQPKPAYGERAGNPTKPPVPPPPSPKPKN